MQHQYEGLMFIISGTFNQLNNAYMPNGERRDISRLANVNNTIGRFSKRRSKACEGRKPTYTSVLAFISTYEAVPVREAVK